MSVLVHIGDGRASQGTYEAFWTVVAKHCAGEWMELILEQWRICSDGDGLCDDKDASRRLENGAAAFLNNRTVRRAGREMFTEEKGGECILLDRMTLSQSVTLSNAALSVCGN